MPSSDQAPPSTSTPLQAPSDLGARMEYLERDNRRLRRLGVGSLVLTAVLLGLATALVVTAARHGMPGFIPDVVEAKEFLLRDGNGRVRGAWGFDDLGAARLTLQDDATSRSVKLNLLEDGTAGLTLSDSAGTPRMVVALLPDETASVVFADGRGLTRTVLTLSPTGASTLIFADPGGNARSGIGIDSRGRAMFTVAGIEEDTASTSREDPESP